MKPRVRSKRENLNGNFGAARVQGKRESLDLTKEILNREELRIPSREESFRRLREAYLKTKDPRLKSTLAEFLRVREAAIRVREEKPMMKPASGYWEMVKRLRG